MFYHTAYADKRVINKPNFQLYIRLLVYEKHFTPLLIRMMISFSIIYDLIAYFKEWDMIKYCNTNYERLWI